MENEQNGPAETCESFFSCLDAALKPKTQGNRAAPHTTSCKRLIKMKQQGFADSRWEGIGIDGPKDDPQIPQVDLAWALGMVWTRAFAVRLTVPHVHVGACDCFTNGTSIERSPFLNRHSSGLFAVHSTWPWHLMNHLKGLADVGSWQGCIGACPILGPLQPLDSSATRLGLPLSP